jgi:glycosyltransferase involved in cell wall biosynthesis
MRGTLLRMPSVSVVTAAYNEADVVSRALNSALAQEFPPAEIIVVDDGSTDRTPDVLRTFGARIRVFRQPNAGAAAARNAGVSLATGEYVAFLDADDEWHPQMLSRTVAPLERNPRATLCFCDYYLIDEATGKTTLQSPGAAPSFDDLLAGLWSIVASASVFRRQAFQASGGFCEPLHTAFEDAYLWIRARELGEFEYVPEPLMTYRCPVTLERLIRNERNRKQFLSMVTARYGGRARRLKRSINRAYGITFMQHALAAGDRRQWKDARTALRSALRLAPLAIIKVAAARGFRTKNLRRAVNAIVHPFAVKTTR